MWFKLLPIICVPAVLTASAYAAPLQGYGATVAGRAHVEHEADGTYIYFNGLHSIAGVVPFGYKSTFPGLDRLDGRDMQITGVVDGQLLITLTSRDQIRLAD
jgi:hypothetical protein